MRPSAFLRALSANKRATFSPSPVAPWPSRSELDGWLTAELDQLLPHVAGHSCTGVEWAVRALDVAIAAQRKAVDSVAASRRSASFDADFVDGYLDDAVELLDACNGLRERMETAAEYAAAAASLQGLGGAVAPARARATLGACASLERRWSEEERRGPSASLGKRLRLPGGDSPDRSAAELNESLSASKALAELACGVLSAFLSFKPRRSRLQVAAPPQRAEPWATSLYELQKGVREEVEKRQRSGEPVLDELRSTAMFVRDLRNMIEKSGAEGFEIEPLITTVESLRRSSRELEEGIRLLEGRVSQLYKLVISIRMALLGALTDARS